VRRRLLLLGCLTFVAVAVATAQASLATFTSTSTSTLVVNTAAVNDYLHLYSQSTDPDGLTGYATCAGTSPPVPAATGSDTSLAVNLGSLGWSGYTTINRVFTLQAPATFPNGVTQITATLTLQADASGKQPITSAKLSAVGGSGGSSSATLSPGTKLQVNLRLKLTGLGKNRSYTPSVVVTVTFAGSPTNYYQYVVPVSLFAG